MNRTGRSGTLQYGLDDHRGEHVDKLDVEFARTIMKELSSLVADAHAGRAILCASPRMLGHLREVDAAFAKTIEVDEIAHDLVKLTPAQLREQLSDYGLLPARSRKV